MSGDRELLELAAEAVGIEGQYWESDIDIHRGIAPVNGARYWNPLNDDGDALRLVVKLDMDINSYPSTGEVAAVKHRKFDMYTRCFERVNEDKAAAVRRAIVRCAAEFGKGMA